MKRTWQQQILRILKIPTVSFHEEGVAREVARFASRHAGFYDLRVDDYGNLWLLRKPAKGKKKKSRRVLLQAHLDHPGFEVQEMVDEKTARLYFYGGMGEKYFPGSCIQFQSGKKWVKGTVLQVQRISQSIANFEVLATLEAPLAPGTFGVWDLPQARLEKGIFWAPACDDLAGVGAILCALDEAAHRKVDFEGGALFTRAEEPGCIGGLGAIKSGLLKTTDIVIACETGNFKYGGVVFGEGAVVRTGDFVSTFDFKANLWLDATARLCAKRGFKYQRKLMDGGITEASIYSLYNIQATGLTVALGNCHNQGEDGRPQSEYVSEADLTAKIELLLASLERADASISPEASHQKAYDGCFASFQEKLKTTRRRFLK